MIAGLVDPLYTPSIPVLFVFSHSTPISSTGICAAGRKHLLPAYKSLLWAYYLLLRNVLAFFFCSPTITGGTHPALDNMYLQCVFVPLLTFLGFCLKFITIKGVLSLPRANSCPSVAPKIFKLSFRTC